MNREYCYLTFFTLVFFLCSFQPGTSQVVAGVSNPGEYRFNPNVNISLTNFSTQTDDLDLDCDGIADIQFRVYYGNISVDDVITIDLIMLDSSVSVLIDTVANGNDVPLLADQGDSLSLTNGQWASGSNNIRLALFNGGFGPPDYYTIETDRYLFWKKGGLEGWFKGSWDIYGGGVVSLDINEVLRYCRLTSLGTSRNNDVKLYPNPLKNGNLKIENDHRVFSYQLFSPKGVKLQEGRVPLDGIELPDTKGIYLVSLRMRNGSTVVKKIVQR